MMKHVDINLGSVNEVVGGDPLTPRIVQYKGKRYCIRLEDTYWAVLEAEAKARGIKLNQVVHEYYTHPDGEGNRTAFLRRHTVAWLAESLTQSQERLAMEGSEVRCVLSATPEPAFLFSEDMSVSRHNRYFRAWLAKQVGKLDEELLEKMRVSFRSSIRVLMDRIKESGGITRNESAAILLPGYALTIRVNVVSIQNYQGHPAYLSIIIPS